MRNCFLPLQPYVTIPTRTNGSSVWKIAITLTLSQSKRVTGNLMTDTTDFHEGWEGYGKKPHQRILSDILQNKQMNTFHQEPRFDCKNFALCGIHSLSKCRKYKGRLPECKGCTLVRRKSKTLNNVEPSRKVCPHCGKELNITMFGLRRIHRNGKEYVYRASWCKLCSVESAKKRYRNKALSKFLSKWNDAKEP